MTVSREQLTGTTPSPNPHTPGTRVVDALGTPRLGGQFFRHTRNGTDDPNPGRPVPSATLPSGRTGPKNNSGVRIDIHQSTPRVRTETTTRGNPATNPLRESERLGGREAGILTLTRPGGFPPSDPRLKDVPTRATVIASETPRKACQLKIEGHSNRGRDETECRDREALTLVDDSLSPPSWNVVSRSALSHLDEAGPGRTSTLPGLGELGDASPVHCRPSERSRRVA